VDTMAYKNPQDQTETMRRWYLRNKRRVLLAGRHWRAKNPESQMVLSAKGRAKRFGLPFRITSKDVFIPLICPILGIVLQRGLGQQRDNSPSLDRIIPQRGYVRGNIQVISNRANSIKRNATSQEIRKVADWLARFEKG